MTLHFIKNQSVSTIAEACLSFKWKRKKSPWLVPQEKKKLVRVISISNMEFMHKPAAPVSTLKCKPNRIIQEEPANFCSRYCQE